MKIQLELDSSLQECEVILRCPQVNEEIAEIQKALSQAMAPKREVIFYQGEKEFYLPIQEILFFETGESGIHAHTAEQEFTVKQKLYELEEMLPAYFIRISKSTIANTRQVYSITKNITSASKVEFRNSYKVVYASRNYYKPLVDKMSTNVGRI